MANDWTKIQGTDIISKTCDIINDNFESLNTKINSVSTAADAAGYAIKEMTLDASNNKFKITFNNGTKPIKSDEILPANQNRSGLLSNLKQLIGGDKLFEDNITLNSNDSKLYGTNNKPIIQQDKNHVYIGGGKGIVIEYDDEGNFKNISIDRLSINLSENDKKTILNYVNSELESAVDELTKQTDSTVTIWQIEGLDIDSKNEVEMINSSELDKVNRPWKDDGNDTNDEDSAHIGDVLYSKTSKTYYEFTENYVWIISTNNIFGSINDQISKMQLAIDGINVDGKRNFIWATRTEMFSGANVTKHSKGDIWVVKADENEKVAEGNPYKNFTIGGLYLCESTSNDEHTGKDSTHSNSNNWKLLYDYDNYLEYQIKSGGKLYNTVTNAETAKNVIDGATEDNIISVVEKLSIINEWRKISGKENITDITFDKLTNDYESGSYGDALQTAIKTLELKTDIKLDTEIDNLKKAFKALGEYLKDKIEINKLSHVNLTNAGTSKTEFLNIFNTYYTAEQNIYSKISGKAITDVTTIKSVVDELTQQTDSTITIWQIDGLNTDSSTEKDSINASGNDVKRPWAKDEDDTNDEDSAHIGDVLYSKTSKTYYEFTKDYKWIISTDNIFGSINDQISGMQSAIDGISVDGKINFIFATRTQMYNGDDVTKHSKGDIWVVKAEEKGSKITDENPYKNFTIGGLYLCESASDDIHNGKDSTHNNGEKWTLLTTSLNAFDVTDDVTQHGTTTVEGGLSLTNLLFVNDTDSQTITGGLSGVEYDNVGLFLGSTYEQAYGAANWDNIPDNEKKNYYNDTKPTVPVLLTKSGYGSNIGGCYLDDINQKLMVPVGNIDGEITCKSLKADNDSINPNDAEATVTPNAFKIKYGNAYIEISLVNGVPTIIGVDSNGETSWSFGAGSNDSAMYNLIYNAIYGNVLYKEKTISNGFEFDSLNSKVNISLPTFTIVNKYDPVFEYKNEYNGSYMIIPLKTRMKYKIGNKSHYFYYDVTQKCPYYAEVIDILCGFPIDIDTNNTNQSLMYYLYNNEITGDNGLLKYISDKYGITITETDLRNDIGNTDESYKCIDKHDMKYSQYYIDYIKSKHLSNYNYAIFQAYYNTTLSDDNGGTYGNNHFITAGNKKTMYFHDDFYKLGNYCTTMNKNKYENFYTNFTTNSFKATYEVKIYNQDGEWKNIIAGNNTGEALPYDSTNQPSYVITSNDTDWNTYKKEYIENNSNGITKDNFDSTYLFVFDKQDGLPTPRNLCELAFNSWWYSLDSLRRAVNEKENYNKENDDYFPRIFDVTSEIELFDTGIADQEYGYTMTHIDKVSKYNYESLFNVSNYSNVANSLEKKYTDLKLVYANYNGTNILAYNTTKEYIKYRLSITESISGDVYIMTRTYTSEKDDNSDETYKINDSYLLNDEIITSLPTELTDFFSLMKVNFELKSSSNFNTFKFNTSYGTIEFDTTNTSDNQDWLTINMTVTPPGSSSEITSDNSIDFDTTTLTDLKKTIRVTRFKEKEKLSSIYQKPGLKDNLTLKIMNGDATTADDAATDISYT
jgi:hypothetical protein